jgi:hypothetical protein
MSAINERRLYQAPQAVDLSGLSATGDGIYGLCESGTNPSTVTCQSGPSPYQNPASCFPTGNLPNFGRCGVGSAAMNICNTGSIYSVI